MENLKEDLFFKDYMQKLKQYHPKKAMGQNFLVCKNVAEAEAAHAVGKRVIEIGPGLGLLTHELCKNAKEVVAVEKDKVLYELLLQDLGVEKNVKILHGDFFKEDFNEADIMISNIPYGLSSKTLIWLNKHNMEAVICIQKEFAERMLAKQGSKNYSRISIISNLNFSITKIMEVKSSCFYPKPKVDSMLLYIKPKKDKVPEQELGIISLFMEHKKKTLRNAIIASAKYLGISKKDATHIADNLKHEYERVFKLSPETLLEVANDLKEKINS
ncbi:MAG: 16S rRNA (adenine(1518)-N(6)/adenine(1519)-N(6))-dimethyltransferase RsmA [Candidatus Micrarchaeia archaeon]